MSETYEQLRDSVTDNETRAAWRQHDRRRETLTSLYRELKDDPRYTAEYKAEMAWEAFEDAKSKIAADREKALGGLEKEARGLEMMAMPRPKGETLAAKSPEQLLAAQNEAGRIVRKVERLQNATGPLNPNAAAVLREEYVRGMDLRGIEGVAICQGTLRAADELGIPHSFLDDLRTQEQMGLLGQAQRYRRMSQSIGKRVPEPPFPRPGSAKAARLADGGPTHLFVPRARGQQIAKGPGHGGSRKSKES